MHIKVLQKITIQKTGEATSHLIVNKISNLVAKSYNDKITTQSAPSTPMQTENDVKNSVKTPKEIYITSKKRNYWQNLH